MSDPRDETRSRLSDAPLRTPFVLTGEIDIANAPTVGLQLAAYADGATDDVVVDCSTLTFIDSFGLAELVKVYRSLQGAGLSLRLVDVQPSVRQVLEITGLARILSRLENLD